MNKNMFTIDYKRIATAVMTAFLLSLSAAAFGQDDSAAGAAEGAAGSSNKVTYAGLGYLDYQFIGDDDELRRLKRNGLIDDESEEKRLTEAEGFELYFDIAQPKKFGDMHLTYGGLLQRASSDHSVNGEANFYNSDSSRAGYDFTITAKVMNILATAKLAYQFDSWLNKAGVIGGAGISTYTHSELYSDLDNVTYNFEDEHKNYPGFAILTGLFADFNIYESYGAQISYSRLFTSYSEKNGKKPNADSYAMAIALRIKF